MQGASFSYVVRADRKQIVTSRKSLKKGKKNMQDIRPAFK